MSWIKIQNELKWILGHKMIIHVHTASTYLCTAYVFSIWIYEIGCKDYQGMWPHYASCSLFPVVAKLVGDDGPKSDQTFMSLDMKYTDHIFCK